ncbi:KamA family radical SAM protein [Vallitalea guaymasensis]|uniref:KamA family radical SAM protein n=1 Tax=Vallitalea guaymasensis TaxID=1185412 RepID=A0A8J8SDQ4_9FIRM|nr:KamA family radical SAM protein [Vallitalea guaymasensis]QUH30745.1 KamA family radical SAM protein [Vallitalea guaymasensis]
MDWKKSLITTGEELKEYIPMTREEQMLFEDITRKHPFCTTKYYLSLIDRDDSNDPIKKMQIPSFGEKSEEGVFDTSGESENTKMQGLQHKYKTTALLLATNSCAMYCRHCFRKRLVGLSNQEVLSNFEHAVEYIKQHKEINNILITGGDAFFLPTNILKVFMETLSKVEHIDFIRFGTRIPVVLPHRIIQDEELINALEHYSKMKQIYVVTQFNHPRELTDKAVEGINRLKKAGIIINNQTVLLKGVNDNPTVLAKLMNDLVKYGVNPYYLFQCRPVKGVKHSFQVPLAKGIKIVEDAKKKLSGHSKRFKFIMSHKTGKIEILGEFNKQILFKYHQSPIDSRMGTVFSVKVGEKQGWLDDDICLDEENLKKIG